MASYLIAIALLAALLAGWVAVQAAYRRFARRHPECGPYRDEGAGGCGACATPHSCTEECGETPSRGAADERARCNLHREHRAPPHKP